MRVTLQPSGTVLEIAPGERILNAAQRLGYKCPQSCRNDHCYLCTALLIEGRVEQAGDVQDHGAFYTCLAVPLEDCVVLWNGVLASGELPMRSLACQLTECVDMGADVWRVRLRAPAGPPLLYYAGQYVMLERENGEKSAFSLASAPHSGRDLEIHILAREGSARSLIEQLQRNKMARLELPFGDTYLSEVPDGQLVLIAAGTGMAQMHSLIEYCREKSFKHPVHLYWGVRRSEDFYTLEEWDAWQHIPNLFLHKVVSDLCSWGVRYGLLHEAVCEDISDLKAVHVYASGSPAMIYGTLDSLVSAGMDAHQMHADVFAYAPRS